MSALAAHGGPASSSCHRPSSASDATAGSADSEEPPPHELLFRVLDGCKSKYILGGRGRRVSRSDPLFAHLQNAFGGLADQENLHPDSSSPELAQSARIAMWRAVAVRAQQDASANDAQLYWKLVQECEAAGADENASARIQIDKDLPRTGAIWQTLPEAAHDTLRAQLRRVLLALVAFDASNGYTQGLNLIGAEFLCVTRDEEAAFWLMVHVVHGSRIAPGFWSPDVAGLKRDVWVLLQLLDQHLPGLTAHLRKQGLDATYAFIGPLLSMFASALPPGEPLHGFFDVLLANGETTLFAAWVALLQVLQPRLMMEHDTCALMDELQRGLDGLQSQDPEVTPAWRRGLLEWCVVLEPGVVAEFRRNAPMQWCNLDQVLALARELDRKVPPRPHRASVATTAVLVAAAAAAAQNMSHQRNHASDASHADSGPETSEDSDAPVDHVELLDPPRAAAARNLRVVWVASNLRGQFSSAAADEYRQAAVQACSDVLTMHGYADTLRQTLGGGPQLPPAHATNVTSVATTEQQQQQQHTRGVSLLSADLGPSPGPLPSVSPLLPGSRRHSVARELELPLLGGDASSSTLLSTTSSESDKEQADDGITGGGAAAGSVLWRAPDSYASLRTLLETLMAAVAELLRGTSNALPVFPVLERLYLCLRAARNSLAPVKFSRLLLADLASSKSAQTAAASAATGKRARPSWGDKLRGVFRAPRGSEHAASRKEAAAQLRRRLGVRRGAPASDAASAALSPSLADDVVAWAVAEDEAHQFGFALRKMSAAGSPSQQQLLAQQQQQPAQPAQRDWAAHAVLLLFARKTHAENLAVGVYEALPPVARAAVRGLFSEIARALQTDLARELARQDGAVARKGRRASPSKLPPSEACDGEFDAAVEAAVGYRVGVWSLDAGEALFAGLWSRARIAEDRAAELLDAQHEPLSAGHRRFHTGAPAASTATTTPRKSSPQNSSPRTEEPVATTKPLRARLRRGPHNSSSSNNKTRAKSSPWASSDAHSALFARPLLPHDDPALAPPGLDASLDEVSNAAAAASREHRARYWALRSNYHLVALEMARLAAVSAPPLACLPAVEKLASQLHAITFELQTRARDAQRAQHVAAQLLSARGAARREQDAAAHDVLLQNVRAQAARCRDEKWRALLLHCCDTAR